MSGSDQQQMRAELDELRAMRADQMDAHIERRIDRCALELQTAKTPAARHTAFNRMRALHALRSPKQIAQMECDKGLR